MDRARWHRSEAQMCGDVSARYTLRVSEDPDAIALSVAANQSRFRASNEHLLRSALSHHFERSARVPFICECPGLGCTELVMLTLDEYERIRSHPTWFLLVAGHEDDESPHERIIEAENGYAITEKIGPAGVEAKRLDSRQTT